MPCRLVLMPVAYARASFMPTGVPYHAHGSTMPMALRVPMPYLNVIALAYGMLALGFAVHACFGMTCLLWDDPPMTLW